MKTNHEFIKITNQLSFSVAKKLILILMTIGSIAYAADDCSEISQKIVDKLASHKKNAVTIDYSADQAGKATTCKAAILAKNPAISVTLNEVPGTGKFKPHK